MLQILHHYADNWFPAGVCFCRTLNYGDVVLSCVFFCLSFFAQKWHICWPPPFSGPKTERRRMAASLLVFGSFIRCTCMAINFKMTLIWCWWRINILNIFTGLYYDAVMEEMVITSWSYMQKTSRLWLMNW